MFHYAVLCVVCLVDTHQWVPILIKGRQHINKLCECYNEFPEIQEIPTYLHKWAVTIHRSQIKVNVLSALTNLGV